MNTPPKAPPKAPAAPPPQNAAVRNAPTHGAASIGRIASAFEPPRIIINGVEGWGKTSALAHADNPVILMARGETGYQTLLGAGRVPQCDGMLCESWGDTLAAVDYLIDNDTGHKTIGLDALGGFERLCHEHVCATQFNGDWGEKGFASFQKGYDLAVGDWLTLLVRLDRLRAQRGMAVVLLSHVKVTTFKNPAGPDYDKFVADCHHKTWGVTHKWADAVLFGTFFSVVEGGTTGAKARKGKGIGGSERVLYTQHHDAWDAKNRYGLDECIDIPNDPTQSWATIWHAINGDNK